MTAPLLSGSVVRNEALWAQGLDAYPTSTGDALAATWERTLRFNPTASIGRWLGRQYPDWPGESFVDAEGRPIADPQPQPVPRLSAAEANERFGLEGKLKFEDGVPQPVAEELAALKREELRQADVLNRSPGGFLQGAGELAVGFAGSAVDPLNIASAFIPVVGQARFASWAANGVARARFAKGAIEGAVGAVLVEPIVYGVAQSEQADYTAMDSLLNVGFGTALGGGLHAGAGWLGDRFGAKPVEERETQLRGAVADLVDKGTVAPSTAQALEARIAPLDRFDGELAPAEASSGQAPAAQRLRDAWQAALGKDKPVASVDLEAITPAAAEKLDALFRSAGLPFDAAGFRHVVEYDAIRHVNANHGPQTKDLMRGLRPVTEEEFARLPDVLRNPDDVRPGEVKPSKPAQSLIVFEKKLDGRYFVVEQVRAGKRTLALKSMYIQDAAAASAAAKAAAANRPMEASRNPVEPNVRNAVAAADSVVAKSAEPAKRAAVDAAAEAPDAARGDAAQAADMPQIQTGESGQRRIDGIDPALVDPDLGAGLADADLASAVARSQADLDALIAAGLVRADDPEILTAADLAARGQTDARAHDAAAFCLGRNA